MKRLSPDIEDKLYGFLLIAAMALALALLGGCAVIPDTVQLAVVHQSQPMRGRGPAPLGGDNKPETTYETIEAGARWEHGVWFAEISTGYVLHETYLTGGNWIVTMKSGIQFPIKE